MFDETLERRSRTVGGRAAPWTAAVALHAAALAGLGVAALLTVRPVEDPPDILTILVPSAMPDLGVGGPPPPARARPPERREPETPPVAGEPVQPTIVPDAVPVLPQAADDDLGLGEPDPSGVPGGLGAAGGGWGPAAGGASGRGEGPGDAASDAPIALRPDIRPPRLLTRIAPAYPEVARRASLEGMVVLEAVIGLDGAVEDLEVVSSTNPLFESAALEAVSGWRYAPARLSDRPVKVFLTVTVTFRLR